MAEGEPQHLNREQIEAFRTKFEQTVEGKPPYTDESPQARAVRDVLDFVTGRRPEVEIVYGRIGNLGIVRRKAFRLEGSEVITEDEARERGLPSRAIPDVRSKSQSGADEENEPGLIR